jgi:hypothetical protein
MTQQHPITPPSELLDKWYNLPLSTREIFVIAAQWGWDQREPELQERADQELDACCEWLRSQHHSDTWPNRLRAARRPKPPNLAEQGLKALGSPVGPNHVQFLTAANQDDIRAALKRLAELEANQ